MTIEEIRAEILRRVDAEAAVVKRWKNFGGPTGAALHDRHVNRYNALVSLVTWMDKQAADPHPDVPSTIRSGGSMQTMTDPYRRDFK